MENSLPISKSWQVFDDQDSEIEPGEIRTLLALSSILPRVSHKKTPGHPKRRPDVRSVEKSGALQDESNCPKGQRLLVCRNGFFRAPLTSDVPVLLNDLLSLIHISEPTRLR